MKKKEFIVNFSELDYLKEDMYQASYGNYILDLGYYGDGFLRLKVIKNEDWENPLEEISFLDAHLIEPFIEILKNKLESGFYDGNYIVNEGYEKEL